MKKLPRSTILKICANIAVPLFAIAIFRIVLHFNQGFHPWAVVHNLPNKLVALEEQAVPKDILNQKFYFLAKGKQSFAFLSSCGRYVLKIPNNHYYHRLRVLKILPKSGLVAEKITYNTNKLNKVFNSYAIACTDLKDNSAVIYAHLSPSNGQIPLQLVDALGCEWTIPGESLAFIVQKKAELVYPYLSALRTQGSFEQAERALDTLLDYLERRCRLGIADNDPLIRTNLGFIEGNPIQIDIGPFSYDPAIANPKVYQKELLRICASLNEWLNMHFPEAVDSFAQKLKSKMIQNDEENLPKSAR